MRYLLLIITTITTFYLTACNNEKVAGFCEGNCKSDSLNFKGDHALNPQINISLDSCKGDTMTWGHDLTNGRMVSVSQFLGQAVHMNPTHIKSFFKDTSYAWLEFNDCKTGRGFLLKLNYNKIDDQKKILSALTHFDPKFSIDDDLVAYTDRGSVFVENKITGKQAMLSFDKAYDIDFNKLHEMVDSVRIDKARIFIRMLRNGEPKDYEKKVSL